MKVASLPLLPLPPGGSFCPAEESLAQVKRTALDIRTHPTPILSPSRLIPPVLRVLLADGPLLLALSGTVWAEQRHLATGQARSWGGLCAMAGECQVINARLPQAKWTHLTRVRAPCGGADAFLEPMSQLDVSFTPVLAPVPSLPQVLTPRAPLNELPALRSSLLPGHPVCGHQCWEWSKKADAEMGFYCF